VKCLVLKSLLGRKTFTSEDNPGAYQNYIASYWSTKQSELSPACVFPASRCDIAVQILVSRLAGCPFAVKSSGYASFACASSIDNGSAVSLKSMTKVSVSPDRTTVLGQVSAMCIKLCNHMVLCCWRTDYWR
ncbi:uncharacterized protein BCR38DRAFT_518561, partial [Pseudomassariella vexata]